MNHYANERLTKAVNLGLRAPLGLGSRSLVAHMPLKQLGRYRMEGESKCSRKKVIILKHFDFHALLHYHSEGVCSQLNYLKFHFLQFQVKISIAFFKQILQIHYNNHVPTDNFHFSLSLFFPLCARLKRLKQIRLRISKVRMCLWSFTVA